MRYHEQRAGSRIRRSEVRLIWRDPTFYEGEGVRLIWRGGAILPRGGSGRNGGPVNLAVTHRFNRNGVGGKEILLIWRPPAVLTGGGREKGSLANLAGPTIFTGGGSGERGSV